MTNKPLDGQMFKKLVEAGLAWLKTNQQTVNALNVFPVPDGDTGTNMLLTMQSAYAEIANSASHHVGQVAGAVSQGALMGARGNSGVILSQLWRGFARAMHEQDVIDAAGLAKAFAESRDTAYKGVVRPVEGTILTVAKDNAAAAEKALADGVDDPVELLRIIVSAADASVQRTPELLPILKQAGVVDSGGKGLFFILEGMLRYLDGLPLDVALVSVQPLSAMNLENSMAEVEEGQDWEVVVDFKPQGTLNLQTFYAKLEEMGTSIQVGEGDGMYRMHIHVPLDHRYSPIEYIMSIGTITKVAMENLLAQMDDISAGAESKLQFAPVEPEHIAVIAVSPGRGLSRIFASLGVAAIVEGGQTMNPSTKDILDAFENLPTDKVIILPNNKNIVLAANQAKEVTVKQVRVIPSRNVAQGLSAMLHMHPEGDLDHISEKMIKAIDSVICGEITIATRSVEIDGVTVKDGEVIGLLNGKLAISTDSVESAALELLAKANAADYELITLFYGEDLPHTEANRIADVVREKYPQQEVEVQEGGQPHYQFIMSIE
jgi:hypothetical protein